MILIAVMPEHVRPARVAAEALRGSDDLEVTPVLGGRASLKAPGVRHALAAAAALVYVAERSTESLPWREMEPGAGQVLVVIDVTGQLGTERALRLGARGYVAPNELPETWARRVRQAAEGNLAFPPVSVAALAAQRHEAERLARGVGRLSRAQLDTVRCIGRGLNTKQIAELRRCSYSAVRKRLGRIMKALGVGSDLELAALAGRLGLDREEEAPPGEAPDHGVTS